MTPKSPQAPASLPRYTPAAIITCAAVALLAAALIGAGQFIVAGSSHKAKVSDGVWTYATLQISGNDTVTIYESESTTNLTPPAGDPKALPRAQVYNGKSTSFQPRRNLSDGGTASSVRQRNTLPLTMDRLDREGWEVVVQLPSANGVRLLIRKPR